MGNKTEKTAIELMSENIVNTSYESFDSDTINLAKKRIIDIVGCAIGGANAPGNKELMGVIDKWGETGEATIWIHGGKGTAQSVAMMNTVMDRSYDFEVMSFHVDGEFIASHHASTNVPTAFAMAEAYGLTGKELLTAMLLGDDIANRVAAASKIHPIQLGWDGCGTLSHLGATAIACKAMKLNATQSKHAFGIVLNTIASAIQSLWDGATTFKMGQGTAARNGILSAELAGAGWTGVIDALQSRYGFFTMYGGGCGDETWLTRDLGKMYIGESYFKPYPCGLPNHVAIRCALDLLDIYDINCDDIAEIEITVPNEALTTSYYAKPFEIRDFPHGDAIFSYPYTVATTLLHGSCGLPNFTMESILDPKAKALTDKTKMVEPSEPLERLRITLKLTMADGTELVEAKHMDLDWIKDPTPTGKIENKFWHQVDFSNTISRSNAEQFLDQVENLESADDINTVVQLLIA